MVPLVDTHAHLDMSPLGQQVHEVVSRANSAGVGGIVTIGIDAATSRRAVEIAEAHETVWAAVGIHPHDAAKAEAADLEAVEALASRAKVVAIGEIGLDFAKEYSPRDRQRELFRRQLEMAQRLGLPVVVHARSALEESLATVQEMGLAPGTVVFHCFSGGIEMAREVVDAGYLVSVTGIVTFPKAEELRASLEAVPMDRIMLETDCPFLSPVPYRGKTNEPARLVHVAEALASLKGMELDEVARWTTANAECFFGLELL